MMDDIMVSNVRSYSSKVYSERVLNGFSQLRDHGQLCDVNLIAEKQRFPAHRSLLASSSDYFRAMFGSQMRECNEEDIELRGVTAMGLKCVMDFIYSGKLEISLQNIECLLQAASHLQVTEVLEFCKKFLCCEITKENCVEIGVIANTFHLESVDLKVNMFMLENFNDVTDFNKIPVDRLAILLASDVLKDFNELQLFNAARGWIESDVDNRLQYASRLMKHIRFPLISPTDLITHVQTVNFMKSDPTCMSLLLEASNYQMVPYMQPVLQTSRTQIRSESMHLVALGGVLRHQLDVSKDLRVYDDINKRWFNLASMESSRYQHGIAVIGNFLFVVGGQSNYDTKGKTAVDTVFRYDPRYNRWMKVQSLIEKRTFFHLSAIDGKLYAVGGRNAAGELSSVECYYPKINQWNFVEKMMEPHYGHAGTVYNGKMYISGGITHDSFQKKLLCYDPEHDKWDTRTPMSTVRGLHCMTTVGDKLYVIGGNHFKGTTDYDDVLECEFYLTSTNQWTSVAPMLTGQSDVGVAVFNGRIYVTGGYSWNNRCMVDIVQCYDPDADKWSKTFNLPAALGGVRACTLTVLPRLINNTIGGRGVTDDGGPCSSRLHLPPSTAASSVPPQIQPGGGGGDSMEVEP